MAFKTAIHCLEYRHSNYPQERANNQHFAVVSSVHRVPVEEGSAETAPIELMGCSARAYLKF